MFPLKLLSKPTKLFRSSFKKQCKSLANQTISSINSNIFDVFSVDENKGVCQFTKTKVSIATFQSSSSAVLVYHSAVVSIVFEELDGKNGSSEALRHTIESIKNNLVLCQTTNDVAKSLVNAANVAHHSLVQSTTKARLIITASVRPLIGELYTIILSIGGGHVYQFDDNNSTTVFEETTDGFIGFPKPHLKKCFLKGIRSSITDTIFVQSHNLDISTTDLLQIYRPSNSLPKLSLSPSSSISQQCVVDSPRLRNSSINLDTLVLSDSDDHHQINHLPPLYRSKPFTVSPRSTPSILINTPTSLQSTPRPAFSRFIQNRLDSDES
ncbi:hypothetical protein QTN25_007166 [Entamoeba marina]